MNNNSTTTTVALPYSVLNIKVNPIDPTSKLSHNIPGEELFTQRNDFLSFKHQTHLATLITLYNELYDKPSKQNRAFEASFTITVLDAITLTPITARSASVKLNRNLLGETLRVDVPFPYSDVSSNLRHIVRVTDRPTGQVLLSQEITLWPLPEIKSIPTRWFTAMEAAIVEDFCFNPRRFRSPGENDYVSLKFHLNCALDKTVIHNIVPELQMRLYSPSGTVNTWLLRPKPIKDYAPDMDIYDEDNVETDNCLLEVSHSFSPKDGESKGVYYCELLCMGYPFTGFIFNNAEPELEGYWQGNELTVIKNYTLQSGKREWTNLCKRLHRQEMESRAALAPMPKDVDSKLDLLTGLDEVKMKVKSLTCTARFGKLRIAHGLPSISYPLHSIFMGSPGTGKTTVAKILGEELHKAGVLSRGHVVIRERSSLVGRYYGDEEKSTREALEEAQGGILFIDEAYQLHQPDDPRDPGKFVIETLMTTLADESQRDWMLILAGYTDKMERLFDINPGLRSRIPDSNVMLFPDYTSAQLMDIAVNYLTANSFVLSDEAREALKNRLSLDYANRSQGFGNARHVINMIQTEILPAMAQRTAAIEVPETPDLQLILPTDIPASRLCAKKIITPRIGFAV